MAQTRTTVTYRPRQSIYPMRLLFLLPACLRLENKKPMRHYSLHVSESLFYDLFSLALSIPFLLSSSIIDTKSYLFSFGSLHFLSILNLHRRTKFDKFNFNLRSRNRRKKCRTYTVRTSASVNLPGLVSMSRVKKKMGSRKENKTKWMCAVHKDVGA